MKPGTEPNDQNGGVTQTPAVVAATDVPELRLPPPQLERQIGVHKIEQGIEYLHQHPGEDVVQLARYDVDRFRLIRCGQNVADWMYEHDMGYGRRTRLQLRHFPLDQCQFTGS